MNKTDIKNPSKEYRPIPFWSWNEKLDVEETKRQVREMHKAGLGGFFMHARGGLLTEYMGVEWFANVEAAIEAAEEFGMSAWAYDENGWPSGFGNGLVSGLGVDYQQKYLRWDKDVENTERLICVVDGYRFYYDVNPFYVDTMNATVTDVFIDKIYKPYYEKYKNTFQGFFTDEPQISRNGIPWSFILPDEYQKEYGENLLEKLGELFFAVGDYENTRMKFWRLVTMLFSQNYMKRIYDWCTERNLGLTGHMVLEEDILSQVTTNGACMPHYEYFTMPGMDWLGRDIYDCFTPLQLASVAAQTGKKEILSESFALCGHNIGFDELKAIYQWHMVHGITKLCQHLEGYSLEGLRKRDFPPAMYYQQPWWSEYKAFNDAMSRVGVILAEGGIEYDTLLIHNQSSGWKCFDNAENKDLQMYSDALLDDYRTLMKKHLLFHFGDEIIMERHGRVEGDRLVIGNQSYKTVVIPKNKGFFENTQRLLKEFEAAGGRIVTADEVEGNDVCSATEILYTERIFEGYRVLYFVNNTDRCVEASFKRGGKVLDIMNGETSPFSGTYTFAPYDSLVLIDDGSDFAQESTKELKKLDISGMWNIAEVSENILTIDNCDVYFDGELAGRDEAVVDVLYMALDQKRSLDVRCDYKFNVKTVPENAYLVCEAPYKFDITVNGAVLERDDEGYFVDKSFRKIAVSDMLKEGENVISAEISFAPHKSLFESLENAYAFEGEKNKLTFDIEFEPIYIIGDFAVKTHGKFKQLERNALRYTGGFEIHKPQNAIDLSNIEQQGFPFFAGKITVSKKFCLYDTDYKIAFKKKGVNVVGIRVNGVEFEKIMWGHLECDISSALKEGENVIELTLVNNLRNMMGPHHLEEGECYYVCPCHFYKRSNVWTASEPAFEWNDDYCFAEVSVY